MRLKWYGAKQGPRLADFTARCIGCGGIFKVPKGFALSIDHLDQHHKDCELP